MPLSLWGLEMRNWCRRETLEQWVREAQWEARGGQRRSRKSSDMHKQGQLPAPNNASLPLVHCFSWLSREYAGKFILSKQGSWCPENHNTKFACRGEWQVHIQTVIRKMRKGGLLTFQRHCSDISKSTCNYHHQESVQHRTNGRYLCSIGCGPGTEWSTQPHL